MSLIDFLQRTSSDRINKKCVESLIRAGAFDELEPNLNRYDMLESYEKIMDSISNSRRNNLVNQVNLFDTPSLTDENISSGLECKKCGRDISMEDILAMEKEMTGMYLSGNPLDDYMEEIKRLSTITAAELNSIGQELLEDNSNVSAKDLEVKTNVLCGLVSFVKPLTTKSGKQMAFVNIQDMYDEAETILFPNVYSKYKSLLTQGSPIMVKGKISLKDDEKSKILVEEVKKLNKSVNKKLYIRVPKEKLAFITEKEFNDILMSITNIIKNFPGSTPVYIYFEANNKLTMLARKWWVSVDNSIINTLKQKLGDENIKLK
jgi:DNA polymerase-3 subunit alpha